MENEKREDLKEVFDMYYGVLYKTAAIILCNEQDAHDAVQETLIRYLENKKEFYDEEHRKAWLLRVIINICKNMLRFQRLHPTVEYTQLPLSYCDEKDYALMHSFLRIREKSKEVLILRYIQGYSNKEIMQILRISENAVKKRLERAKKELKQEYEK